MSDKKTEIFEKMKAVVAEKLNKNPDEITMEKSFTQDLGADSLDMVELVMDLEEKFGIQIKDDAMSSLITVGDVVAFIEANMAKSE